MAEELPLRTAGPQEFIKTPRWENFGENVYECRVLICPEDGDRFSAHALRLPGVVSQGDSHTEALQNIKDAFVAAIAVYREQGDAIPWEDINEERPKGSIERWILIHA